jgi:hypothetical protein
MKIPGRKPWSVNLFRVTRRTPADLINERKANGLCVRCGQEPRRQGRQTGVECARIIKMKENRCGMSKMQNRSEANPNAENTAKRHP